MAEGPHGRGRSQDQLKKKVGNTKVVDLLGIALGCIGLRYDDFLRLRVEEFDAIYESYAAERDSRIKNEWEQTRTLASILIQPHLDGKHRVTAQKLLPFPWDNDNKPEAPTMTKAEQRARMDELIKRFEDNEHD